MGKSEGDSQGWLVTYSDLVTLILTFFVLLYTMTSGVEDKAFNSFLQYFKDNSGFLPEAAAVTESINNQADPQKLEEQMERWQAFADFLEEQNLSEEVDIKMLSDGVKITLSDSLTFESGSSDLLPAAKQILLKVSEMMDDKVKEIEVQGHTDNVPIARDSFYQTNWHLGAGRSVSVVQFLQGNTELSPGKFKATSFGEYHPVSSNETPEGRRQNRRVEIYLRDLIKTGDINLSDPSDEFIPAHKKATF